MPSLITRIAHPVGGRFVTARSNAPGRLCHWQYPPHRFCAARRKAGVATQTTLGRHVIVNRGSLIGHHTTIGDYVTVSPGANIAGRVTIGEGTYISMSAVILNDLTVGCHAIVGAGAVVTHAIPDRVQVIGTPAKIGKEGIGGR